MNFAVWAEYAAYVFLFMITPGPSHLLMISNSIGSGFSRSYACAVGDLSANSIQILIAGLGIGAISQYASFLLALKVAGVLYLLYSGAKMLYDGAQTKMKAETAKSRGALFFQGFVTSIVNPKAVIFFSALLPQFIFGTDQIALQLAILGITYIIIDGSFLVFYGVSASSVANWLGEHSRIVRYVPGVIMVVTAIILGVRVGLTGFGA